MKTLLLIRHAKSSWNTPEAEDFIRPLNQRGRLAATLMGAWLVEKAPCPDLALVSAATRTRETWARMDAVVQSGAKTVYDRGLYLATPATMLEKLRDLPEKINTVALVAHQPGIASLARKLATSENAKRHQRLFTEFPTATVAVLQFPKGDWVGLDYGSCEISQSGRPKDQV